MFWVGGQVAPVARVWSLQKLSFLRTPMFRMMVVVRPTTYRKKRQMALGIMGHGPIISMELASCRSSGATILKVANQILGLIVDHSLKS